MKAHGTKMMKLGRLEVEELLADNPPKRDMPYMKSVSSPEDGIVAFEFEEWQKEWVLELDLESGSMRLYWKEQEEPVWEHERKYGRV